MCLFTYTFHACGHTSYDFAEPTLPSCTSITPCETPSLDNEGEGLIISSTVLASTCTQCVKSTYSAPTPSSRTEEIEKQTTDPYALTLPGLSSVLEVSLTKFDYSKVESWQAFQAVKLLSRMTQVYDICGERKPSRDEVHKYIVQVVGKIDTARAAGYAHPIAEDVDGGVELDGEHEMEECVEDEEPLVTRPRLPTIEEVGCSSEPCSPTSSVLTNPFSSSCPSLALPSSPKEIEGPMFSEGTMERQLFTLPLPIHISTSTLVPSYPLTTIDCREQDVVNMMRDMRLQPSLYFSPNFQEREEESKGSIITDPFLAKEEKLGRDAWECDFCGLECFCKGFDD